MSTKSFKKLSGLSLSELQVQIKEADAQFFEARMKHGVRELKDTALLWRLKRKIAQMKMLQSRIEQEIPGHLDAQKTEKKIVKE